MNGIIQCGSNVLVIIRQNNYFGMGGTLQEAGKNYRKASGRNHTSNATIVVFTGDLQELKKIEISDIDGSMSYPKNVVGIRISV